MDSLLVTGGAGFIGSALVRQLLARGESVIVLDALTYSGNRDNLAGLLDRHGLTFVQGSIADAERVRSLLERHRPRAVLNLAAETHVDRSLDRPEAFVTTNVVGVHTLLEASVAYWRSLSTQARRQFRFLQVSTDEVYGSIHGDGAATESTSLDANSPYAATKAAADLLVRAYSRSYGLPAMITRGSNAYGPRQFPEKLIPLLILRALSGATLPIYGDGQQVREWIHVDDTAAGIIAVLERGEPGEIYNLGKGESRRNIDLAHALCALLDQRCDLAIGTTRQRIDFVADRPAHDQRYCMDCTKVLRSLGWRPTTCLEVGLSGTVDWYIANSKWRAEVVRKRYDLGRLGAPPVAH